MLQTSFIVLFNVFQMTSALFPVIEPPLTSIVDQVVTPDDVASLSWRVLCWLFQTACRSTGRHFKPTLDTLIPTSCYSVRVGCCVGYSRQHAASSGSSHVAPAGRLVGSAGSHNLQHMIIMLLSNTNVYFYLKNVSWAISLEEGDIVIVNL